MENGWSIWSYLQKSWTHGSQLLLWFQEASIKYRISFSALILIPLYDQVIFCLSFPLPPGNKFSCQINCSFKIMMCHCHKKKPWIPMTQFRGEKTLNSTSPNTVDISARCWEPQHKGCASSELSYNFCSYFWESLILWKSKTGSI